MAQGGHLEPPKPGVQTSESAAGGGHVRMVLRAWVARMALEQGLHCFNCQVQNEVITMRSGQYGPHTCADARRVGAGAEGGEAGGAVLARRRGAGRVAAARPCAGRAGVALCPAPSGQAACGRVRYRRQVFDGRTFSTIFSIWLIAAGLVPCILLRALAACSCSGMQVCICICICTPSRACDANASGRQVRFPCKGRRAGRSGKGARYGRALRRAHCCMRQRR